jgi:hypothetical protein
MPPGILDICTNLTSLRVHLEDLKDFDTVVPKFKSLVNLKQFEVSMWKFPVTLTLEKILEISPPKVGPNMIISASTILARIVNERTFNRELGKAAIDAGADPNLEISTKRLRALDFCETVEAAKFLLEEAHADLVYISLPRIGLPKSIWSISNVLSFLYLNVAQYIVDSPAADRVIDSGSWLVPPGSLTPNIVQSLNGNQGKDALFRWLAEPRIMERLGGYKIDQLSSVVQRYIEHARIYPSQ